MATADIGSLVVRLLLKAAVLAAGWAGAVRVRGLAALASLPAEEKDTEIVSCGIESTGVER